jgi:predicted TIM-barrel fold metal-dependent hydrolase
MTRPDEPDHSAGTDRRRFLGGLAAVTAASLLPARQRSQAGEAVAPHRIDVHSHISPPAWIQRLTPEGLVLPPMANWTVERHLADMDRAGVATAITSVTAPGLWFKDPAVTRPFARACNDYAATLRADHPGRFGVFIVLPWPDVEGSLRELEYGLDTLKADGIAMLTNYGDTWLGDAVFAPLFAELNRRKALVYTHPTAANCCRNLVPGLIDATIEFGTDTTRAIARMVFSGSAARYPDMRMIFSHAGGSMPYMIERFDTASRTPPNPEHLPPGGFRELARKFYYDTAQASNPVAMAGLRAVVPMSQILFGTDYPFRTAIDHVTGLAASGTFTPQELLAIDRGNYLALHRTLG